MIHAVEDQPQTLIDEPREAGSGFLYVVEFGQRDMSKKSPKGYQLVIKDLQT